MGSRGIISAKTEASKSYVAVERNDYHYVEITSLSTGVTVFVDETCLDTGTVDPKSTIQKTKWIVIEEVVWQELLSDHRKETKRESWGDSVFFEKIKKHVWGQFAGGKVNIKVSGLSSPYTRGGSLTEGNVYLIIPYTHYPEFRYKGQVIKLVYLTEPYVRYVYIDPPTAQEADVPIGYDNKLHLYGMKANINISTHLLPDFRKIGKAPVDKNICNIIGTVFFVNDAGEEITVGEFNSKIDGVEGNYNNYQQIKLLVDPAWREAEGVHQKNHQPQKYFVKIMATAMNLSLNLNSDPKKPYDFTENIKNIFHPKSYNTNKDFTKWYKFDGDQEDWIELPMQPHIEVRWDTMEMIYKQLEIEKNNQIQYIGDIEYFENESDPCGYSTITIKDEDDKKRQPLVIFDENAAKIDNTERYFEVTTGEKVKTISIKLGELNNKDVYCSGLLLEDKQKHNTKTNVFQVDKAVYSAMRDGKGGYAKEEDKTHKEQLNKANTPITKANTKDYDVIKNPDNSKIKIVQSVLRWQEGKDYSFKNDDEINLNLKYNYNKALTISNDEFNPNFVGNLFEEAWLFNYLLLNIDKNKQVYYLPISTCRYPNQIAKINVLPDIKWTLLFKFNFEKADFEKFKEEHNYEVHGFFVSSSQTTAVATPNGTATRNTTVTAAGVRFTRTTTEVPVERKGGVKKLIDILKRIEVSLTAEWKDGDGKKQQKDVIDGFLKQIYNFFAKISDIAKLVGDLADGEGNEEDRNNKKQMDKEMEKMLGGRSLDGAWKVLTKKPQETEVLYPSIAIAASWYYADADDPKQPQFMGRKSLQIDAKVEAAPIIGVEIKWDFLEMLARRHPIAFIIKKGIDLLLYLSDPKNSVEITFTLSGDLGLTANFKHNMLAGNAYANGNAPNKQELISGKTTVKADLKGSITTMKSSYIIISEYKVGGQAKIGVKAAVANKVYLGADTDGLYIANATDFDGLTFYLEAEAKLEFTLFGVKIIDWNPKYEPEPFNWGKCSMDWMKVYLNNPNKKTEFINFKTGDDE